MAPEIRKRSARFLRSHSLPELGDRASSLVSSRSVSSGADSTDSLRLSQILATDNSPSTQSQARTSSSEHGSLHATSNNSADESCLRSTRRYREEDGGWSVPVPVPDADGVDGVSHTITNTVTFDTRPPSETSAGEEEIKSAAALFLHGRAAREGPGATHVQNRTISSKEELDPSLGVRIVENVLIPAPLSGDQHVFKRDARKRGKKKIGLSGPAHQWPENRRPTPPLHEPSLPTRKNAMGRPQRHMDEQSNGCRQARHFYHFDTQRRRQSTQDSHVKHRHCAAPRHCLSAAKNFRRDFEAIQTTAPRTYRYICLW